MKKFQLKMPSFLLNFWNFDIEKSLSESVLLRNPAAFRIFVALLLLNVAAYFLFISQHPLYNHGFRIPWIAPNHGYGHGRWFNWALSKITTSADIYAFVPLLAILMNVTAGIMTIRIWNLKLSSLESFLVIGLITTYPAFLSFYYFSWTTILFMSGGFLATLALYFCREFKLTDIAIGSVIVMFMMASYQPSISVYATIASGATIATLISKTEIPVFDILKTLFARILASAIGLGAYALSVKFMGITSYTTDTVKLADVPKRVFKVIDVSIEQLSVTQPELMTTMKAVLLALLVAAIVISVFCVRRSFIRIALVLAFWFGMLVMTKAMYLLSPNVQYFEYRYNTSLAFLHSFTAAILMYGLTLKPIRSAAILFVSFLLLRFVQADLIRQEVLLRGQQHDMAFANRLLVRMESLPELDFTKTYDLIRIGKYPDYRDKIMKSFNHNWQKDGDYHMDDGRISASWADEDIFILLGSRIRFKHKSYDPQFQKKAKEVRATLLDGRKPWPHPSSVFVSDDKLIVYLE